MKYPKPNTHRLFEIAGITVFAALWLFLFIDMIMQSPAFLTDRNMFWVLPVTLAAYLFSDFVSGMVHFMGDTYCNPDTPIIGPGFIKPFRDHHVHPEAITIHDFVELTGNSCLAGIPLLGIAFVLFSESSGFLHFIILLFILFFSLSVIITNIFHKWAHQVNRSGIVLWLQRSGLILSPVNHAIHHSDPFNRHYCMTNGWLNPLLDKLKFFTAIKKISGK